MCNSIEGPDGEWEAHADICGEAHGWLFVKKNCEGLVIEWEAHAGLSRETHG